MQAKFTEWNGKTIRECDLPPGVKYHFAHFDGGQDEYLKCDSGRCVILKEDGERHAFITDARSDTPVTILDWPDHCGPRPDGKVTYREVVENAPSKEAFVVWKTGSGKCLVCVDGYAGTDTEAMYPILGYLELTD